MVDQLPLNPHRQQGNPPRCLHRRLQKWDREPEGLDGAGVVVVVAVAPHWSAGLDER